MSISEPDRVVESLRPVSESGIWKILLDFYVEQGLEAWRDGVVPQWITSNAHTADVYASVTAAFLRDCARLCPGVAPLVLEVGGGSGLFAWNFLNRLPRHLPTPADAPPRWNYMLTDAVERNVTSWLEVPRLRALVDSGRLNVGSLKIESQPCLRPVPPSRLGEIDLAAQPVVLIANYVLDSIPCELMCVRDGVVLQELVALERPENGAGTGGQSINTRFESRAAPQPYTPHAGVNAVIEEYRRAGNTGTVPIPLESIAFLDCFFRSPYPFLMLAGDMAYTTPYFESESPFILRGYVACIANFHLLGRIFEQAGGGATFSRYPDQHFSVGAFMKPAVGRELTATHEAARAVLSEFTVHDAYNLERGLRDGSASLDFRTVSAWLRLSRFDPYAASVCIPHLIGVVERDEWFDEESMRDMLLEACAAEFPEASGLTAISTHVAYLFVKARMYEDAVNLLSRATPDSALRAEHRYMLAVAMNRLGRVHEARSVLTEILVETPTYWHGMPDLGENPAEIVDGLLAVDDTAHLDYIVLKFSVQEFARRAREEKESQH